MKNLEPVLLQGLIKVCQCYIVVFLAVCPSLLLGQEPIQSVIEAPEKQFRDDPFVSDTIALPAGREEAALASPLPSKLRHQELLDIVTQRSHRESELLRQANECAVDVFGQLRAIVNSATPPAIPAGCTTNPLPAVQIEIELPIGAPTEIIEESDPHSQWRLPTTGLQVGWSGVQDDQTKADEIEVAEQKQADTPETDTPETDTPETDTPETDTPETDTPEDDTPETDTPETDTPEDDTPEKRSELESELASLLGEVPAIFDLTRYSGREYLNKVLKLLESLSNDKETDSTRKAKYIALATVLAEASKKVERYRQLEGWALSSLIEMFGVEKDLRIPISTRLCEFHSANADHWLAQEVLTGLGSFAMQFQVDHKEATAKIEKAKIQQVVLIECECELRENMILAVQQPMLVSGIQDNPLSLLGALNCILNAQIAGTSLAMPESLQLLSHEMVAQLTKSLDKGTMAGTWKLGFEHLSNSLAKSTTGNVASALIPHLYQLVLPVKRPSYGDPLPNAGHLESVKKKLITYIRFNPNSDSASALAQSAFNRLNLSNKQILDLYLKN